MVSGVVTVEVRPMAGSELCELSHFGPQTGTERHGRALLAQVTAVADCHVEGFLFGSVLCIFSDNIYDIEDN